ncbi:DUF317 domain-containing protein [Yinghuangia aomiensis]|uniref:DUF317 domain-containing protein n=1 Tax=Yinghuangia aomiensis TaxID=676205 RepID=A0ABP9GTT7_9ACTN
MVTAEQLDAYAREDELRELLVSPRYLAGTGLDLDMVIRPLADAGFAQLRGPDGEVFMHSRCHRIRAAFLPEGDDLGLWQVVVAAGSMPMHLPLWKAVFDDGIPAEAVAAFTTALAADLAAEHDGPEGRPFLYAPFGATPGWYPLGEAGWHSTADTHQAQFRSPDGQAELVCNRGALTYAGEMGAGPYAWELNVGSGRIVETATFTSGTPTHLIAAFTSALTNPTPVIRNRASLARRHLAHLTVRPVEPAAALPAPPRRGPAAAVALPPGRFPTPTSGPPLPPAPAATPAPRR